MNKNKINGKFLSVLLLLTVMLLCCALCACNEIEVCFDTNYQGGSKITQVISDGKLSMPKNVAREGYLFDGWYLDQNCTQKLSETATPKNGDVYYANWIALPQSLSATFDGRLFTGDKLTKDDLTVTVTYSDNSTKVLQSSEFTADLAIVTQSAGQRSALISYTENAVELHTLLKVEVQSVELTAISATYTGGKIFVGDTVSEADFSVSGTYSNGATSDKEQFVISGFSSQTAGEKIVTVTSVADSSVFCTVTVEVVKPLPVSVSATYNGRVAVGAALDESKFEVVVLLENGKTEIVETFTTSGFSSESAGKCKVTVSCTVEGVNLSAQCAVTVAVAQLTGISAQYSGSEVFVNGRLNLAHITVVASYDLLPDKTVSDFWTEGFSSAEAGEKQVKVCYNENGVTKSDFITVQVVKAALQSISVQENAEIRVLVGQSFNRSLVTVKARYADGSERTVTEYSENLDSSAVGEKNVTISYTEDDITKTATVTVQVVSTTLQSISVQTQTVSLFVGQTLNHELLIVKANYSDGSQRTVTQFTDDLDSSTEGEKNVTISYTDCGITKTATVTVQVVKATLQNISVQTQTEISLFVGETLNHELLTVKAHYTDGSQRTVTQFTDNLDSSAAGEKNVTISYTADGITKTATFSVKVVAVEVVSISVRYTGAEVLLYGAELNKNTVTVTATYNNGTTAVVSNFTTNFNGNKSGEQTVTVSYTLGVTKTETFSVRVYAPLQSVSAQYNGGNIVVGGELNNSEIYVTAFYADGTSREISNFNVGAFSSALAGTQVVEISYTEQNPVTVTNVTKSTTVNVVVVTSSTTSQGNFSAHFMELGNKYTGDSIYIKAGNTDILIDAGSRQDSAAAIAAYIDKFCTDGKLEYVIATHAHQDHIAGFVGKDGAQGIFDRYECENIIQFARTDATSAIYKSYCDKRDAEVAAGANLFTALECYNNQNGAQRIYDLTGDGTVTLEILYQKYYENKANKENDYSVCVMFHQGDNHYLFTGDLEEGGEASLVQSNPNMPEVVLYKGGHHGSSTSSTETLLSKIKPQYICICTCAGSVEYTKELANTFPTQETVNRISKYTDRVYATSLGVVGNNGTTLTNDGYTSLNGNIVFSCNNGVVSLNCSNNNIKLKDTDWFKANRTCPVYWQEGTSTPSMYHD